PYGLSAKLRSGHPGVLLTSGEFIEGEFKGVERGRVTISSVLLGLRSFDVNNDVIAVAIRNSMAGSRLYEITTADGSLWVAAAIDIQKENLILHEQSLGLLKIPFHDLIEVRRRTNPR